MAGAEPFDVHVSQESLDDLRRRLSQTRWPPTSADTWQFGTSDAYLRELVDHWIDGYDWRATEAAINAFSNYRAMVPSAGGTDVPVHFIHERGKGPNPLPLIATHGWPWSFWDLRHLIGPLTDPEAHGGDPADSFDVVVPSLPGFAWSSPLPVDYLTTAEVADLWVTLMQDVLGYGTFCAQGGDWGAIVSAELGHGRPESVHGIALTLPVFPNAVRGPFDAADLAPHEVEYHERTRRRMATASAHVAVMGTDPQTLAHALHDSPTGLLSWLVERRRNWSDCELPDGTRDVERRFSKDELLDLASIYWHTNTFWSTARMYYGRFSAGWEPRPGRTPTIEVPTAMAVFPGDLIFVPRKVAERTANIERWELMAAGGHFAAAEEPGLVVNEVREFFRRFRR